jgi:hypothetical protein
MAERHGVDPCLLCLCLPLSALHLRFTCGPSCGPYQRMRKPRRVVNGARMFAGRW